MCSRLRAQFEQQLAMFAPCATRTRSTASRRQHRKQLRCPSELQNGGKQIAATSCGPEFVRRGDDGGNSRRDVLRVQPGRELAVDEEAVATQDDRGIHPFALPDHGDQISDAVGIPRFGSRRKSWRS